jgi:hypothetical protein
VKCEIKKMRTIDLHMAWSVFWQIERVNVEDIRRRQKGRIRIMKKRITALVQRFFDAHILSRLFLTSIFPVKCFGC